MYMPSHFAETRAEVMHQLVRDHPLAVLVTHTAEGLDANHVPMEIDPEPAPYGTLRGHVSRANPVWKLATAAAASGIDAPGIDALAIFQGPEGYISPAWYETKRETGKVVPTWNYAVVHAHGRLRAIDDPVWLRALVERLTARHEAKLPEPWQVSDAPEDYVAALVRGIVGIELSITRLVGKWKVSQNRPEPDRAGVARGLRELGTPEAEAMAGLVGGGVRIPPGE